MKILILGATGATGRLVVQQIVNRNIQAKIVVRDIEKVSADIINNELVECIQGNIADFTHEQNLYLVNDCDGVVSCLGHNITLKGIYGKPRMLVTDAIMNICEALKESKKNKIKLILMNTTGNRNRKIKENYSLTDRIVFYILRHLLPPQKDNEDAASYLSDTLGNNNSKIEWTAVRPDTLINTETTSEYEVIESPKQSPIFKPGKTSRVNVSHFMTELLTDEQLWDKWKYKMPVIYNREN